MMKRFMVFNREAYHVYIDYLSLSISSEYEFIPFGNVSSLSRKG